MYVALMQEQVDDGIPLNLCLSRFSHWLQRLAQEKNISYNTAGPADGSRCTFVTWSGESREIVKAPFFGLQGQAILQHFMCLESVLLYFQTETWACVWSLCSCTFRLRLGHVFGVCALVLSDWDLGMCLESVLLYFQTGTWACVWSLCSCTFRLGLGHVFGVCALVLSD